MIRPLAVVVLTALCVKICQCEHSEGKQIADRLGDDLGFASKQIIRGFTAIFGPLLDTAQDIPKTLKKVTPGGGDSGVNDALSNFQRVLVRDGLNAVGKGAKAGATILTVPARVAGTGLEEARKVGQAGMAGGDSIEPRMKAGPAPGSLQTGIEDGTKVASTLLNTTASEFSQANLGAVLVEVALKNRVKDIGNKTVTYVQSMRGSSGAAGKGPEKRESGEGGEPSSTTSRPSAVDPLLEQFKEAVRQNDERVLGALRGILAQINPPKN